MDWESPKLLLLALPALALLLWFESRSAHPMEGLRKRLLLVVRMLGVLLVLLALAGPARVAPTGRKALGVILDASHSMGPDGAQKALQEWQAMRASLGATAETFGVLMGDRPALLLDTPEVGLAAFQNDQGGDSDYGAALAYAQALFPAGTSRDLVIIGDGHETRGSLINAARRAAASGVRLHALPMAGPRKPDARVRELAPSRSRLNEGATLQLTATVESTVDSTANLKLFENGIQVEQRSLELKAGQSVTETFVRTPGERNIFRYRAVLEGVSQDSIPANNSALALVDVRGRLRMLYLDSDATEAAYLQQAMAKEGMDLDLRQPGNIPTSLDELAGYDGILLSDVPAHRLGQGTMTAMRDYVDKLGGGLIMLGGPNSFALGGYYKTPVDELLPVRLKAPDEEEKQSAAVAIVLDRSGSMAGEKLEMAKSASIATAEILGRNDSLGVYAFDSEAHVVVPMTRLTSTAAVAGQIATVASGGGTNLQPAFEQARDALRRVKARVKHMIVLTDGQTAGSGYEAMASQCRGEGITISTVAIGEGSHVALLQSIASSGGGQSYSTTDAASISRIFTQDTLMHTGRMLREEPFLPRMVERHPMLTGFEEWSPPDLLGYVKTIRKATAQVPLVTDTGDPLLAHWRYGLGKVTAFTSDARSRWASLWLAGWSDFSRFWSQLLRDTARPPQGRYLDLGARMEGETAHLRADLQADAGTRANDAQVKAEVYFVAADALGAPLTSLHTLTLGQTGPGLYEGSFRPDRPGVYLIRAQSGAETVSAGLVYNPGSEASLGTVNDSLLNQAVEITGGQLLESGQVPNLGESHAVQYIELWPRFLLALLPLFLLDLGIRRWEHVQGLLDRRPSARPRGA